MPWPEITRRKAEFASCSNISIIPSPRDYEEQLGSANFLDVEIDDVTESWKDFTASRLAMFRNARSRNIDVHGQEIVDGLDDFYSAVAGLFQAGAITGLKIVAHQSRPRVCSISTRNRASMGAMVVWILS